MTAIIFRTSAVKLARVKLATCLGNNSCGSKLYSTSMPQLHSFMHPMFLLHSKQTAVRQGSLPVSLCTCHLETCPNVPSEGPSSHTVWPKLYIFTIRRRMSVSLRLLTTSIRRTTGLTGRHLGLFDGRPLLLGPLVLVLGRAPFFLLLLVTATVVAAA